MRGTDNTLQTISAAAAAITLAQNDRVSQSSVHKKRWASCWSMYWCFGSYKHNKRIGHADLVSETVVPDVDDHTAENPSQAPHNVLPFVAPPSSPASFLLSETPSATPSPSGLLSLTPVSSGMFSPIGPASIFAIGPFAHETQLVSPPVFSTFTTEPSTAPFTPPPESVHFTPPSPEVPFAQFFGPNPQSGEAGKRFPVNHYEFQSYQLHPGSPIGQLISPRSVISVSGTSSPFLDCELSPGNPHFIEFQTRIPPNFLSFEKLSSLESRLRKKSATSTLAEPNNSSNSFLLGDQESAFALQLNSISRQRDDPITAQRLSFEVTAEKIVRCVEKKPETVPASLRHEEKLAANEEDNSNHVSNGQECSSSNMTENRLEESSGNGESHHRHHSLMSVKEFNFQHG